MKLRALGKSSPRFSAAPSVHEIIVVDDGSTDGTWERLGTFPQVRRFRNERNLGKAASMDRGVREAKYDVIFFCDADLKGFRPDHAEMILTPVLRGMYDMMIGVRGNFMQRAVRAWALNSGERALRKRVWHELPNYYKYGFRVEAALNHHVRRHTAHGFSFRIFDYTQPLKETKYGIVRGTIARWIMNFDVMWSYTAHAIGRFFPREIPDEKETK